MCGIFGLVLDGGTHFSHKLLKQTIARLFILSESRGKEAAGLAARTHEAAYVLKAPVRGSKFRQSSKYTKLMDRDIFRATYGKDNHRTIAPLAVIGHSRLVTNGRQEIHENNQPVVKNGAMGVHNGIVVNHDTIWKARSDLERQYEVDTEVICGLIQKEFEASGSLAEAARRTFQTIEGSASIAVLFADALYLLLATNTGSLFTCQNKERNVLVFASEKYILRELIDGAGPPPGGLQTEDIIQLRPGQGMVLGLESAAGRIFDMTVSSPPYPGDRRSESVGIIDLGELEEWRPKPIPPARHLTNEVQKAMWRVWERLYSKVELRRCTKCLLPETMPFIEFDEKGVCNFCRNHKRQELLGPEALEAAVAPYRKDNGEPDCMLSFSGGRDSAYGLHYVKNILKMNPICYTYDWGVVTDLGRRNQARMVGRLGVEHVIVSADIDQKRAFIGQNIEAWLKKPDLGVVPLLMAGDKHMVYYGRKLQDQTGTKLTIHSIGCPYEYSLFKIGFSGVYMPTTESQMKTPALDRLRLLAYYGKSALTNPGYINRSIPDSLVAFWSIFLQRAKHLRMLSLFEYISWDEKDIVSTLVNEYNWEVEKDTIATWRIDDGTAQFYNYIYMTVAGFTEFDTFRSIQIRDGVLEREKAFELVKEENKPRSESIEWYADIIGFDCNRAIQVINNIPRLYRA